MAELNSKVQMHLNICNEINRLYARKNHDYGDSFHQTFVEEGMAKTSLFINGKNIKAGWCQRRISYYEEYRMTADDFCSYGERKEGAD